MQNQDFSKFLPALMRWVDCLMNADELEKAQRMLTEMLPGYYRENPPFEVTQKLKELHEFLMTSADYQTNPGDRPADPENAKASVSGLLRGALLKKDIEDLNAKGITPHVVEFGPGDFWVPIGLKSHGVKFTYEAIALHGEYLAKTKELLGDIYQPTPTDRPVIYFACEIIEHLWNEWEIRQWFTRMPVQPKIVHISTPKYKFHGPEEIWKSKPREGGHLRTYTPREFQMVVTKMFPEYTWGWIDNEIQHMRGELPQGSNAGFKI